MTPQHTTYRLANPGGEWNRIYALAKHEGLRPRKGDYCFPTIVAERDGRVVGFVSTQPDPNAVVAGPLVIEGGKNPIIFMRLIEAYENVMRAAGVKSVLHTVDANRPGHVAMLEKRGFTKVDETPKYVVLRREIAHG